MWQPVYELEGTCDVLAWCPQVVLFVCKHFSFSVRNSNSSFMVEKKPLTSWMSVWDKPQDLCLTGREKDNHCFYFAADALSGSLRSGSSCVAPRVCWYCWESHVHVLALDHAGFFHQQVILLPGCSLGLSHRQKSSLCYGLVLPGQSDITTHNGAPGWPSHVLSEKPWLGHLTLKGQLGSWLFLFGVCCTWHKLVLPSWRSSLFFNRDLLFIFVLSCSTQVHCGTGLWPGGHHPACCGAHSHLSRVLAWNGPLLSGSFWNRWNHSR